jgi:GT2 family glycosyltransferase
MPRVSVQIVTCNNRDTIAWSLDALMPQINSEVSVIVVDNASVDGTQSLVQGYGISLICNLTNRGYSAAHNQALHAVRSDYVLTLNPDIHLRPEFIQRLVEVLDARPDCGSASGCLLRVEKPGESPKTIDSAGLYMRPNRRQGLRHENAPAALQKSMQPVEIFGPDGAAAFYRRTMLEDIAVAGEIFDEDFLLHKEDIDVCWRARLRGWSSVVVPDAMAEHIRTFRPGQRNRVEPWLRLLAVRNRYLLMLKNESMPHFARSLPAIAAYDLGVVAYGLTREREVFAAMRAAWRLRRRMMQKRANIQSRRTASWQDVAQWFSGMYK